MCVDVTAILIALLELATAFDDAALLPLIRTGLPLSIPADTCRTARNSLLLISLSRPQLFIITLHKEVARCVISSTYSYLSTCVP